MKYNVFFTDALARLREERRYRVFAILSGWLGASPSHLHSPEGPATWSCGCSTTTRHGPAPKVIGAMSRRDPHGHRRRGTRNIAGTNHPLVDASARLADLHRKEAALVFTSGYVSNETGISTLVTDAELPHLSDAWTTFHESRAGGSRRREKILPPQWTPTTSKTAQGGRSGASESCIVFETLYSMDGDPRAVRPVLDSRRYGAIPTRRGHAVGMYGPRRCGQAEFAGRQAPG